MKISKKRLTEIILQECEMMNSPEMTGVDEEGAMAKRQLHDMETYARELSEILTDETQLESWVQAKLTKAADYLKTVKDYVEYGREEGAYSQTASEMGAMAPVEDNFYDVEDQMVVSMLETLIK
mgnify:CR=1 FL=1|tara:strand:- start:682 stop:1053 length:372 start_codon:yes stop_codon:yes gene_type:complete